MDGIICVDREGSKDNNSVKQIRFLYQKHVKEEVLQPIPVIQFHNDLVCGSEAVGQTLKALPAGAATFITHVNVDYSLTLTDDVYQGISMCRTSQTDACYGPPTTNMTKYKGHVADKDLEFELPLALAALSGNEEVLKMLTEHGCSYHNNDRKGNNIMHCLVLISKDDAKKACLVYGYIIGQLSCEDKAILLSHKNVDGLTPLDLAASLCIPEMLLAFLRTDGVFRFIQRQAGVYHDVVYKLPKKEFQHSKELSILHFLICVSEKEIQRFEDSNIVFMEPIASLIKIRTANQENKMGVFLWLLWQFLRSGLFFLQVIIFATFKAPWKVISGFMLTFILVDVVTEIFAIKEGKAVALYSIRRATQGLQPLVNTAVIKSSEWIFMILEVVLTIFELADLTCAYNDVYMVLMAMAAFNVIFHYLFLLQYFPLCAYIILLMNNMLKETAIFLLISGSIYLASAACLLLLHLSTPCGSVFDSNSTLTNVKLGSISSNWYDTYLLSLAIISPSPLHFDNSHVPVVTQLFYLTMLVINFVVLMNLLIAMFNDRVGFLYQYKKTLMGLQRLHFMLLMEVYIECCPVIYRPYGYWKSLLKRVRKVSLDTDDNQLAYLYTREKVMID